MHATIHFDSETTAAQYIAISNFARELSGVPAASAPALPPADPADLSEPEVTVVEAAPAVTRKRRTKAEIEAEAAAKVEAPKAEEPEAEAPKAEEPVVDAPADDFENVKPEPTEGKTYTEAEVQQLATVVARSKGPGVVKDKIAELGASRIGDLTAVQVNALGAYLETQK